jgi:uncharacterized GH25 family protein
MNFLKQVIAKTKLIKFIAVAIILFPINLFAHEFWLEPENFNTSSDSSIIHIKIGTGFIGTEFGFKKKFKDKLYKESNKGRINLEQEDGSFPAFKFNLSEKLNIITYVNNFTLLKYRSLKGFENFLEEQNLTEIIKDYDRNKVPKENYKRFAKTILNFNKSGFFVEKPTLDYEIIVKEKSNKNLLKLGIFLNGAAVKNWPVEIFSKDKNNKTFVEKLKTDKNGNFNLSLLKDRVYLINSVYVFKTKDKPDLQLNSDWVSYWASLTFQNN